MNKIYTNYDEIPIALTVEDFCNIVHVSANTAYYWISLGLVPCVRVGRRICISKAGFIKFLETGVNDVDDCNEKSFSNKKMSEVAV